MSIIADTFHRLQAFRRNNVFRMSSSSDALPNTHQKTLAIDQRKFWTQVRVWIICLGIVLGLSTVALGIWYQESSLDAEPLTSRTTQEDNLLAHSQPPSITKSNVRSKKLDKITFEEPVLFSREKASSTMQEPTSKSLSDSDLKIPHVKPKHVTPMQQANPKKPLPRSHSNHMLKNKQGSAASATQPQRMSSVTLSKQHPTLPRKRKASPDSTETEDRDIRKFSNSNTEPTSPFAPRTQEQRIAKAQNLIHNHLYSQAVKVLEPIFQSPPDAWEPWFLMGTAELGLGHLDKAENQFMEGLTRNETIPYLWVQRALVNQQRGQYGKATDALRQAEFFAPDLPKVQLNLAYVLEIQGSTKTAVEHYRRYLSLTDGKSSYFATRKKVIERVAHMENS